MAMRNGTRPSPGPVDVEVLQGRTASALMRLMKAFGLLEFNLGLAIAHLEYPGESERAYRDLAKLGFGRMVDQLARLLKNEAERASQSRSADFDAWATFARPARKIRNDFVHGVLECVPLDSSHPIHLSRPAWHAEDCVLRMSSEDLEMKVCYVEEAFDRFYKFRQKYRI